MSERAKIKEAERFYTSFLSYTESLFNNYIIERKLDYQTIVKKLRMVCEYVQKDRRYLIHAKQIVTPARGENYHAAHSVRSTIISIIIGNCLKLPKHRLIELSVASLMRDICIIQMPQSVYLESYPLSEKERRFLFVHPIHAYKLLRSSGFPVEVCVGVLEHHERVNGAGYPQHISGDRISLYGKIISAACDYEVFSTKDIKAAKNGHIGMIRLLKNEGKKYDETVVRALLYSLSLYPVGMYVLLSSGKKAQVIDVDPENPRFPLVRMLENPGPDGSFATEQTSVGGFSVARPLTREEVPKR